MSMDRSSTQKINKEKQSLNDPDLTVNYRAFHLKAECTFFSSAQEIFPWINHTVSHKVNFGKFKRTKIISIIFSNNAVKLEINYMKKL